MKKMAVTIYAQILIFCFVANGYASHFYEYVSSENTQLAQLIINQSNQFPTNKIESETSAKPPLNGNRVFLEIVAGLATEFLVGVLGTWIGVNIEAKTNPSSGEYAYLTGWLSGFWVGSIVGAPIGVYFAGAGDNETGSFSSTLIGSAISGIVLPGFSFVGAVIGFNKTRRYKSEPKSEKALINFDNGQIGLAIPIIRYCSDSNNKKNLIKMVNLVKVKF